jgi:hypothetical protein
MALFISHENQHLLWNTIQNVPLFSQTIPVEMQSQWFRDIIGKFYQENSHLNLTHNELQNINKNFILHMINILKIQVEQHQNSYNIFTQPQFETVDNVQYESNEKQNIEFKIEGEKDTPIENMNELIERQERERQNDMKMVINNSMEKELSEKKISELESKVTELTDIVTVLNEKIKSIETDYVIPKVVGSIVEKVSLSVEEN